MMRAHVQLCRNRLQIGALLFMAVVYTLKDPVDFEIPRGPGPPGRAGDPGPMVRKGRSIRSSTSPCHGRWPAPASIRSFTRSSSIFHIGVATSILMSFLIPYAPGLIASGIAIVAMQAIFAAAFLVGMVRMVRRVCDPYIRSISTPDDYFSLALLIVWLAFSFLAAPNQKGEFVLLALFLPDGFLPDLRAVQQDLALPLLSVRPLVSGQDAGVPGQCILGPEQG